MTTAQNWIKTFGNDPQWGSGLRLDVGNGKWLEIVEYGTRLRTGDPDAFRDVAEAICRVLDSGGRPTVAVLVGNEKRQARVLRVGAPVNPPVNFEGVIIGGTFEIEFSELLAANQDPNGPVFKELEKAHTEGRNIVATEPNGGQQRWHVSRADDGTFVANPSFETK